MSRRRFYDQPGVPVYPASHVGHTPATPGEIMPGEVGEHDATAHIAALPAAPAPWWAGLPVLIVTRHAATVEWLARRGITGEVMEHVGEADVLGKLVIGNLPMYLAAIAAGVGVISMPGLRPDQRGRELSLDEMREAGAAIRFYRVEAVHGPVV